MSSKLLESRLSKLEAQRGTNGLPPVRFARYLRSEGPGEDCEPQGGEVVVVFKILDDLQPGEKFPAG